MNKPETEREITGPVDECLPDGRVNPAAIGWSRHPVQHCDIHRPWGRRKRWEYWCVTGPDAMANLTWVSLDYVGLVTIGAIVDMDRPIYVVNTAIVPLGFGMTMPTEVGAGAMQLRRRGFEAAITRDDAATLLRGSWSQRGHRLDLDVRIDTPQAHETLNVVVPWSERRFQFTSKQNCLPTTGSVVVDGTRVEFGPRGPAFGCQDFGRGVWPYRTTWNWASASGVQGGHAVGLTLGGKWTEGTGVTENGIVLDGRLSKIHDELRWEYDRADWMAPWRITDPVGDRVNLRFVPVIDNANRVHAGLLSTDLHCCFGHFHGWLRTDDGLLIEVADLLGWAEEHRARW